MIVKVPSKGAPTPATTTVSPTIKPLFWEVTTVAVVFCVCFAETDIP
ncbi:unannotated protein [freshwater metagenome]|uniref:Unannotated protein n=1 Tax=freshwater metagenome TaxID=449393 RepID=A0A6J6MM21_9ZZZZ